jgi:hypothetical protein
MGIRYGVPDPLLNPDEASIVPRAWELANGGGFDPGWYRLPSLLMDVLAPVQAFFDEPAPTSRPTRPRPSSRTSM